MLFAAGLSGLSLTACSDDELNTNQYGKGGVNILAFGPMPVTRGESIRLTGTQLDKVKEVLFPEGNQKLVESKTYINADFSLKSKEEMTVTIPDQCVPGKLRLVTNAGDTIVSASNITFEEEIKVNGIAPMSVHAGDVVSITGEFVWNIQTITFSAGVKVEAEDFVKNTRNEIQVVVPAEAISGAVTYSAGDDSEDEVITSNLMVDAAVATSLSNATPDFGQQITIFGENFDLVTEVDFPSVPDVEFTVSNDGKSIMTTVPATATSGDIVLVSYSGLTTSIGVTVPLAQYEAGSINPAKNIQAGQTVSFTGDNLDRVAKLVLPGDITLEKGQFTQSKTAISFVVPEEMGDGKVLLVQHDNWSIETDRITMYDPEGPVKVLWKGRQKLGWDAAGQIYLGGDAYEQLAELGVKAGDKFRIKLEPTAADWCAQIWEGHWGTQYDEIKAENYDLEGEGGYYSVTVTSDNLATFTTNQGWGGILLVQGQSMEVTELALVQKSDEKTLWTGELVVDDWANQPYALSDAGAELKDADAKPGQRVNFYLTPTEDAWKLEILEGHWGPSYVAVCSVGNDTEDGKFSEWDLNANGGKVTITLTQAMLDAAYTQQWWGGVFVLNGDNLKCTKITLQ